MPGWRAVLWNLLSVPVNFFQTLSHQHLQQHIQRAAGLGLPPGREGAAPGPRRAQRLQVRSQEGLGAWRSLRAAGWGPRSMRSVHPRAHSAFPWGGTGEGGMCEGAAGIKGSSQGLQGILRACTALLQFLLILLFAHACPLLCPLFLSFLLQAAPNCPCLVSAWALHVCAPSQHDHTIIGSWNSVG